MKTIVSPLLTLVIVGLLLGPSSARAESIPLDLALVRLVDSVELSAEDQGKLTAVNVRVGDRVKRGQLLAQIYDRDAQVAKERAEIEVEISMVKANDDIDIRNYQKVFRVNDAEYRRAKASADQVPNAYSRSELEKRLLAADQAQLDLERAQQEQLIAAASLRLKRNELAAAEQMLARRQILCPLDGVVEEVHRQVGEHVEPGMPVIRVVNTRRLRAEGLMETRFLRPGLMNCKVHLRFQFPDGEIRMVQARVVYVATRTEPHNKQIRVWAQFDNPDDSIRPGMRPLAMTIEPGTAPAVKPTSSAKPATETSPVAPLTERPGTQRPSTERPNTERPNTERPNTARPANRLRIR